MPVLTVYTDPSKLGTCDVPPFVVGDATDNWTLKFHNGNAYYSPAGVSMRVGNVNGLTAPQASAFKWTDRAGNVAVMDVGLTDNIPSLSIASYTGDSPSLVGASGVHVIRGKRIQNRLLGIVVGSGGNGYTSAPTVAIGGGGGSGATATATIGNGRVVGVVISDGGKNYGSAPNIAFSGGGGVGAEAIAILSGASVAQVVVTNHGGGYTSPPVITFTGGVGTTATATAITGIYGGSPTGVIGIAITNPGSGYTDAPVVTIGPGSGGVNAQAIAIVSGGKVVGFSIIQPGTGYNPSISPLVSIAPPPSEISPSAVTTISMEVTAINLVSSGSGFTSSPLVSITGGGGSGAVAAASVELELTKTPYKSDEATPAIMGSVELSPLSDGNVNRDGQTVFDHSMCIIKPRDVATAALAQSGMDWIGTMDPVNAWVAAMLNTRRSVALDLQIFGDGRMLFQGVLIVLNKIA